MRNAPKNEKVTFVGELKDKISESKAVILTDYTGLTVEEISMLRRELRKSGAEFKVVKNTLLKRAADLADGDDAKKINDFLFGPVAVAFSRADEVMPAKTLQKFIKDKEKLSIRCGIINKKFFSAVQIKELSILPSREQLLAKVVGGINAPISGFYAVTSGLLRNLVFVLSQIKGVKSK